ncbi:hypothetical protein, partial [Acinetobacter baumannii]|uniref:hypothetical protein n=1 Tax=Acinetobacter baumannii TaxID=470 RepID=UPI00189895D0
TETQRVTRSFPLRTLAITLATMLVLDVGAGVFYVRFLRTVEADPATVVQVTETASRPAVRTPQEAVRGYFDALAQGDIERALSFGPPGGNGTMSLLEPDSHAQMPLESRPRNISVLTDDPQAT